MVGCLGIEVGIHKEACDIHMQAQFLSHYFNTTVFRFPRAHFELKPVAINEIICISNRNTINKIRKLNFIEKNS